MRGDRCQQWEMGGVMGMTTNSRQPSSGRRGGRDAKRALRARAPTQDHRPIRPGLIGGALKLLQPSEMEAIHRTALRILAEIGLADPTPSVREHVTNAGGAVTGNGRLLFPASLVEDVLARTRKSFVLHGQTPDRDLEVGGRRVHFGTGGMSPNFLDFETGIYRRALLADIYDAARLVDCLDNIHSFWRPVVACDIPDDLAMDLNSLYACAAGTTKHLGSAFVATSHVPKAVAMLDTILGGEGMFRRRPFVTLSCCPVVPPLRFAQENCDNLEAALRLGMSATLVAASQAGATSPSALAGSIAQTIAETLACLVYANLVDPDCRVLFAPKPFVADLRTGAMSAGSGEQAILSAASAQMADFYGIPGSVPSGMTDAKEPDSQAGFEKAVSALLAGHSGSTHSTQAAGGLASLMADCFESYVIDNDMLGVILRTIRGIEVNEETLSFDVIRDAAFGEGHFLAQSQTLAGMERDYFYGEVIDRQSYGDWQDTGRLDMRARAKAKVRDILSTHYPRHITAEADEAVRRHFALEFDRTAMHLGNSRWPVAGGA